jgi:hypothetical protein
MRFDFNPRPGAGHPRPAPVAEPPPAPETPEQPYFNTQYEAPASASGGWLSRALRLIGLDRLGAFYGRNRQTLYLFRNLSMGCMLFWIFADYSATTAGMLRPNQVVLSNSMIGFWQGMYKLLFIMMAVLVVLRVSWPEMFRFFSPDCTDGPDKTRAFRELSPLQQLWFFYAVFALLVLCCVLLSAGMGSQTPDGVSVGR